MPFAAGVKFKKGGAPRYYNPVGFGLAVDDFCWVKDETLGVERVGFIASLEGRAAIQMEHLPRVLREASEEDVARWYDLGIREKEMIQAARERAGAHGLAMKISDLTFVEDRRQVFIHFTADGRVDFRELVKDLAGRFKARIELWQITARKEAGFKSGYGICGRELCCSCWLKEFPAVSMRHAKDQDLIHPPSKLSGPCGRLRCCLRYEHQTYLELAQGAPRVGCSGCASGGACGVVVDRNLLKREVTVRLETGSTAVVPFDAFQPERAAEAVPPTVAAEAAEPEEDRPVEDE